MPRWMFRKRGSPPLNNKLDGHDDSEKVEVDSAATSVPASTPPETKPVSVLSLWRYATPAEKVFNAVALMAAVAAGIAQPSQFIIFGSVVNNFTDFQLDLTQGVEGIKDELLSLVDHNLVIIVGIGIAMFAVTYCYTLVFSITGQRIATRVRLRYLSAFLHQEISYIENIGAGEVSTRLSTSTNILQTGIGDKVGMTVHYATMFFAGMVIAFIINWRLSVVLLSIFPAIALAGALIAPAQTKSKRVVLDHLARAGSLAEEAISSVRIVQAYNARERLLRLYDEPNGDAQRDGRKAALATGVGIGCFIFVIYSAYALAFYWGTTLFLRGDASAGNIVSCFFALVLGAMGASFSAQGFSAINAGAAAAAKLYEVIESQPQINSASKEGRTLPLESLRGEIELRNVDFTYPARPDRAILTGFNLTFPPRQNTAIVGESGAGKTSIVSLVERFYDPQAGDVLLDGVPLPELNLKWLRGQMGLVSQEPTLLSGTVFENVALGLDSTSDGLPEAEKRELVRLACVKANADTFVRALPEGYDTRIGERGLRLSGGQRQRIAIARAIVKDPPILLLDEATSSLDTASEAIVQDALDKAAHGRTTITIGAGRYFGSSGLSMMEACTAHRISTIRNAHLIHCIGQGRIIQSGTHDELVAAEGPYARLVAAQRVQELNLDPADTARAGAKREERVEADEKVGKLERADKTEDAKVAKKKHYDTVAVLRRLVSINRSNWRLYVSGLIGCGLAGAVYPCFAIVFGQVLGVYSDPDPSHVRSEANRLAGYLFAIACVGCLGVSTELACFSLSAEALARRLRFDALRATLRQDPEFFDGDVNSTGSLTSRIGDHAEQVTELGTNIGFMLQALVTLIAGSIVGLAYAWQIALVAIACLPFTIGAGACQLYVIIRRDIKVEAAHAQASQMACESAAAVKTIASLTREEEIIRRYADELRGPQRTVIRQAIWLQGLASFLQSSTLFVIAIVFYFGSRQLAAGNVQPSHFFTAMQAITLSSAEVGGIFMHVPTLSRCVAVCNSLFPLLDAKPKLDLDDKMGRSLDKVVGDVQVKDVHFHYSARKDRPVLTGLSLHVAPGQFIGIAGPSGCGKSTLVALLERFYDPLSGRIDFDDIDIRDYRLGRYRSAISLVAQESQLYTGTVRTNVSLGKEGEASAEEVEEACRAANIHDFVEGLPQGYDTQLGGKGAQLSGGQRQRVALARALIRRPKLLLLDEATSALDSESERIVEQALVEAAKERTCVAVAHRLSSLRRAHAICVLGAGRVLEIGSHDELLAKKGAYYELIVQQNMDR